MINKINTQILTTILLFSVLILLLFTNSLIPLAYAENHEFDGELDYDFLDKSLTEICNQKIHNSFRWKRNNLISTIEELKSQGETARLLLQTYDDINNHTPNRTDLEDIKELIASRLERKSEENDLNIIWLKVNFLQSISIPLFL